MTHEDRTEVLGCVALRPELVLKWAQGRMPKRKGTESFALDSQLSPSEFSYLN